MPLPQVTRTAQSAIADPAALNYHEILSQAREYFYNLDPNVIGIRIGSRRVKHSIVPDEIALAIFVAEKKPVAQLDPAKVIPKEFLGLKTDVCAPLSADAPQRTGDLVKDIVISADRRAIDPVRVHELALNAMPAAPAAANVRDFGDICVIDATNLGVLQTFDYARAYQLFRTLHGDHYDFVTFFIDEDSGLQDRDSPIFQSIFNDARGIGRELLERHSSWGSERLEAYHVMNINEQTWRMLMLQEFGHRFAASVRYKDPATKEIMTDHLLDQSPPYGHWAKKVNAPFASPLADQLDDDKSPMDYGAIDWVKLKTGKFKGVFLTSEDRTYCNLDLYLMGLLGPDQVGEITMLRNVTRVPDSPDPAIHTATPVSLTINDFIEVEGDRVPNVRFSQKHWRQAFIVLTRDMANVHDLVQKVDKLRLRWELKDFPEGTKGHGSVDTTLDRASSNFTVIFVKEHFGNEPGSLAGIERFVHFTGPAKDFTFSCPRLDSRESALLMFQSRAVTSSKNIITINGHNMSWDIPVNASSNASNSNVLFIRNGILRPTGNVLHIESRNMDGGTDGNIDDFILDNMVVMYKTR